MTTITDVAKAAGVSIATVSRSFATPELLRRDTYQRVLDAARKLDYQPPRLRYTKTAPNLYPVQQENTETVAFCIVAGTGIDRVYSNAYYSSILQAAQDEATRYGFHCFTQVIFNEKPQSAADVLKDRQADAGLVIGTASKEQLDAIVNTLPYVLYIGPGGVCGDIDRVVPDYFKGAYDAIQFLIKSGHKNVGIALNDNKTDEFYERIYGYHCSIADANLINGPKLVLPMSGSLMDRKNAVVEYFKQPNRPTAIFAASDHIAYDILDICREIGVSVPDDISIIGFDDVEYSAMTSPPLTTVKVNTQNLGKAAIKHLLFRKKTSHKDMPLDIKLQCDLVVRGSTKELS